jgi:uncharacterized membrane protein YozB (DUF420 family)
MIYMSVFGTNAPILSDLNLLLQIIILIILFIGVYYVKQKRDYSIHGRFMGLALLLNIIAMLLIMMPKFLESLSYFQSTITKISTDITILHGFFGGIAEIMGLAIIIKLRPCGSSMGKRIRYLMGGTIFIWLIALLLGISVYLLFYVF